MNALATLISALAFKFIDYFLARKSLKDGVRKDIALKAERLAKKANEWKADNPIDLANLPPGLKLRPRANKKRLSNKNT